MKKINKKEFLPAEIQVTLTPGKMVRILREMLDLSQPELAKLAGMPQSNLSAIETGAREIGRERALSLAKALKVHPAVILFPDYDIKKAA